MKTVGFALIGCGSVSEFHIESIKQIDGAHLVGVASRSEERAKKTGADAACLWTTDYFELLNNPDVDVVCVTTSSGSHGEIGLDVLHHGKHLVIEKPIAMTASEADKMVDAAEKEDLILSVISQRRFEHQHQIVKQVLSEGKIGNLVAIEAACPVYRTQDYYDEADWRGTIAEDGGALMNQGIHSIDLLLWLGGTVKSVIGKVETKTHEMEAEDIGMGIVKFENGALGTILSTTSFLPGFPPTLNLYGEKGAIKMEGTDIIHWSVPGQPEPELDAPTTSGGGTSDPRAISMEYHKRQLADVVEAITENRDPLVLGIEGRNAVQLIEAIYESSEKKKEIQVN